MQDEMKPQSGEEDNPQANFQLGEMYRLGKGAEIDLEEAIIWYRRASDQGHAHAQFELAKMYATGQGVSQDLGKAATWFEAAARQGHVAAQYNLGQMYRSGEGVDCDLTRASEWYLEAANAGDADAQANLALCYLDGNGVPKDLEKALHWLKIASAQDHGAAAAKLRQLQTSIDGIDRSAAPTEITIPSDEKSAKGGKLLLVGSCSVIALGLGVLLGGYLNLLRTEAPKPTGEQAKTPGKKLPVKQPPLPVPKPDNNGEVTKPTTSLPEGNGTSTPAVDKPAVPVDKADTETREGLVHQKGADTPFTGSVVEKSIDGDVVSVTSYFEGQRESVRTLALMARQVAVLEESLGNNAPSTLQAIYNQAQLYGVFQEQDRATAAYKKAAEGGYLRAQYQLGRMYLDGNETAKNEAEGVKWLTQAAALGLAEAQVSLAEIYHTGRAADELSLWEGVEQDDEKALSLYRRAMDQGHAPAAFSFQLAYRPKNFGTDKDIAKAFALIKPLAEKGNPQAQNNLGVMYENGRGVEKDEKEAVKWYRKAAEQDSATAQYVLGNMYANGELVEKDGKKAVEWLKKAAEQGNSEAQFRLGEIYWSSDLIPVDNPEAYFWFSLAAAGGHEPAKVMSDRSSSLNYLKSIQKKEEVDARVQKWLKGRR